MKAITILSVFFIIVVAIGCSNEKGGVESSASSKCDTVYLKDTGIYLKILPAEEFAEKFNKPILWEDFEEDSTEYAALRQPGTSLENSTIRVRYNINELATYLNFLAKQQNGEGATIDSVDVVFGKYPNRPTHRTTNTEISESHRGKITVMFAGKGLHRKITPYIFPFNVGNPWP